MSNRYEILPENLVLIKNMKSVKAFSLAEVLVVLMVIGIIVTTTIPGLLQDLRLSQYKTAWKKLIQILNRRIKRF